MKSPKSPMNVKICLASEQTLVKDIYAFKESVNRLQGFFKLYVKI